MAFAFGDSVAHYATGNIGQKWTQYGAVSIVNNTIVLLANGFISKTLPPQNGWYVGFDWLGGASWPNGNIYGNAAVFVEPGFTGTANILTLISNSDGTFSLTTGSSVIIATTTNSYHAGTQYFIEVETQLSGNPITVTGTLRINGEVVILNATGNTGVNNINLLFNEESLSNQHTWFGSGTGVTISNIYINDNNDIDSTNNTFMGPIETGSIYPDEDVTVEWALSTGTSAYALIDEHPPDDDNSTIFDGNVGDVATFYFQNVESIVGQLQAIHVGFYARRDAEGIRGIQLLVNTVETGPVFYLSDDYVYYFIPLDTINGVPLTAALVNATTFGVKLVV